jgi:hypothetical protein
VPLSSVNEEEKQVLPGLMKFLVCQPSVSSYCGSLLWAYELQLKAFRPSTVLWLLFLSASQNTAARTSKEINAFFSLDVLLYCTSYTLVINEKNKTTSITNMYTNINNLQR